MIELRDPLMLLVSLAALPVFVLARRRPGQVLWSSLALLPERASSLRARLAWVPAALLACAAALLGLALAGPRLPDRDSRVQKEGVAIMLVVDASGSMAALDLAEPGTRENRLDAVKGVLAGFVGGGESGRGRPDDMIGLVSFARYADCRCPLTLDHANLLAIAGGLGLVAEQSEDGTAMGDGLALAVERLRESPARSKVVVLLTDGVENAGTIGAVDAAALAAAIGVKVYAVGAGTEGLAPMPWVNEFTGREELRRVRVEIDEKTLGEVAARTGGRYFRATDAEGLREAYAEIGRLEKSQVAELRFLRYEEFFGQAVAAATALAAAAWLLGATWWRSLP